MAVRTTRVIKPIRIWIPPSTTAIFKVTVERSDGTIDDVTQISEITIDDGVTDMVGRFKIRLPDPEQTYFSVWKGMEIVRYYSDYAASATTLRFRGRIEKISMRDYTLECSGRSEGYKFMEIAVTSSFETTDCSTILQGIISSYAPGYTATNVAASTGVTLSVNWIQKPFFDCVQELCTASGYDCYIDCNLDFHFFKVGSVDNDGEGIMYNYNLLETEDFGDDIQQVKNKVTVYGAKSGGIQIIYTSQDLSSQTKYGIRELLVNDESITSYAQAKDFADYKLSELSLPAKVGKVKGFLLASIQPGERIWVGDPANGLVQGRYPIRSYTHKAGYESYETTVVIENEVRDVSHLLKNMIQSTQKLQDVALNPYSLNYAYNHFFDEDTGNHTNTEIISGVLKLASGQSQGNWVSLAWTTAEDVSKVYVVGIGETLTGIEYYISADDGLNYVLVENKQLYNLSSNTGKKLRVKVVFSDADTQIDSLSVMYT